MQPSTTENNTNPLLNIVLINRVALFAAKNVFHSFKLGTRVTKTWLEAIFIFPGAGISAQMENFLRLEKQQKEEREQKLKEVEEEFEEQERKRQADHQAQAQLIRNSAARMIASRPLPVTALQALKVDLSEATTRFILQNHCKRKEHLLPDYDQKKVLLESEFARNGDALLASHFSSSYRPSFDHSAYSFPYLLDKIILLDSAWALDLFLMYNKRLKYRLFEDPLNEEVSCAELFSSFRGTTLPCFSNSVTHIPLSRWPLLHVACFMNAKNVVASLLRNLADYCEEVDTEDKCTLEREMDERENRNGTTIFEKYVNMHLNENEASFYVGPVKCSSDQQSGLRLYDFSAFERRQLPTFTPLELACISGKPVIVDFLLKKSNGKLNIFERTQTRLGKKHKFAPPQDAFELLMVECSSGCPPSGKSGNCNYLDCVKMILKFLETSSSSSLSSSSSVSLDPNQSYLCTLIRRNQTEIVKLIVTKFWDTFVEYFEPRLNNNNPEQQQRQNIVWIPSSTTFSVAEEEGKDHDSTAKNKEDDADSENENDDMNDDPSMITEATSSSAASSTRKRTTTPKEPNGPWSTNPLLTALKQSTSSGEEIFSLLVKSKRLDVDGEPFTSISSSSAPSSSPDSNNNNNNTIQIPTPLLFVLQAKLLRMITSFNKQGTKKKVDANQKKKFEKEFDSAVQTFLDPLLEAGANISRPGECLSESNSSSTTTITTPAAFVQQHPFPDSVKSKFMSVGAASSGNKADASGKSNNKNKKKK